MTITLNDFTRINNDTNGAPRYVIHFLALDKYGYQSSIQLSERYNLALVLSKQANGRKFHNKQYGGGIAFATYSLDDTVTKLNSIMGSN